MNEMRKVLKYSNRRLYDCVESRYITLEDLRRLVVGGVEVQVVEKCSGRDLTASMLLQVVVGQEQGPESLLGREFLLHLIRAYGSSVGGAVRGYLEESLRLMKGQEAVMGTVEHPAQCEAVQS